MVLSDGGVNFCCSSSAVAGNVNEESFEKIWNGTFMQRIRRALREGRLPPECRSPSCPIYRGDDLNYIVERMRGPSRFERTGKHDPHAWLRERLQRSGLQVNRNEVRSGDILDVSLEFYYQGDPMIADLFIGIRYPEGEIRFLPYFEEYAMPFLSSVMFSEDRIPLRFNLLHQRLDAWPAGGEYLICAALFERNSNPNLLSNCYWSATQTVKLI